MQLKRKKNWHENEESCMIEVSITDYYSRCHDVTLIIFSLYYNELLFMWTIFIFVRIEELHTALYGKTLKYCHFLINLMCIVTVGASRFLKVNNNQ